jgi:ATP-dependent RNA helicase RhlE
VGESITFITLAETYHWHKIEEIIHQKIEISPLPDDIKIQETPFLEHQDMLRSVDEQRKREDPDFKGAFHDKKWVIKARANGNKAALKGLGKNGLTRSGAVAQGVKTGPKANGKAVGKPGPKGPDRNNRPGKNSKYKTVAPGNKKKR